MEHASRFPAPAMAALGASEPHRRHHRQPIRTLVYVNLDHSNGGILRNVSEHGVAIQTLLPLRGGQKVDLRFELPEPRIRIEATGQAAWTDSLGLTGVQFGTLAERNRCQLKEWLFTQLLASAQRDCASGMLSPPDAGELLFSRRARPAIRLAAPAARFRDSVRGKPQPARLRFPWCPFAISPGSFSGLVDGLILLCAALLFSGTSLAMTRVLPSWPLAVALVSGVTGVFVALYWFLFSFWSGVTPGQRLARIAMAGKNESAAKDDQPQFR
jgi:hypothetical protein